MPLVDFGADVHAHLIEIFGREDVSYEPVVSMPNFAAFAVTGIFDRHHEVILTEVKGSELDASGHSTTLPVLSVRLRDFEVAPAQGDRITIAAETFRVWDIQPDGQGMADLVLRLTS